MVQLLLPWLWGHAMDQTWAGRKLMLAAPALQARMYEDTERVGPGLACIGPIVGDLLRQIGVFLLRGETDPRQPFARTRGVIRFTPEVTPSDLARAYNVLLSTTAHYLDHLPGVPAETAFLVRRAVRHAATESLELLRTLREGQSLPRGFGGAPLLAFRSRAVTGRRATGRPD